MKENIEERAKILAQYIVENGATVRKCARQYQVSKSTVHKDVTLRLKKIDPFLQKEVRAVLEKNKAERHIRGGAATQRKYAAEKENMKRQKHRKRDNISIP